MLGSDRIRYCPQCRLNVYNFSELAESEIQQLVAESTGRLCARFYQRADGTMLTKNCPVGFRTVVFRASNLAAATLATMLSLAPKITSAKERQSSLSLVQIQSAENDSILEVVDPLGAVIANAKVSVVNEESGERIDSVTNAEGRVILSSLRRGFYDITVTANDFSTIVLKNATLPGREVLHLQLKLAVLMGEVMAGPPVDTSDYPFESLREPPMAKTDAGPKPSEHRNLIQKFFSRLRHLV